MTEFMDRQIRLQRAGQKEYSEEEVRLIINGAIQEEREACAKVCENMSGPIEIYNPAYVHYIGCAEAIRARGQSEVS
jgi:hypothetical protein